IESAGCGFPDYGSLRVHARGVPRPRHHPPGVQAAPHAAHGADQRDLVDRRGGRHHHPRGSSLPPEHLARRLRGFRVHDQPRQRIPHHRPDAAHVQTPGDQEIVSQATGLLYLVSAALFILALRWMSQPDTAKRAVVSAVGGMALAVGGTLLHPEIVTYKWIGIAAALGFIVGFPLSRVPLTAVPERTGLSQAFGGLAAGLVGTAKYYLWLDQGELTSF